MKAINYTLLLFITFLIVCDFSNASEWSQKIVFEKSEQDLVDIVKFFAISFTVIVAFCASVIATIGLHQKKVMVAMLAFLGALVIIIAPTLADAFLYNVN